MAPHSGPPGTPTEGEVCRLVSALSQDIDQHVRRVADGLGLTEAQAAALRELPEPRTLRELAVRMCCQASNATFVADRLESMGLLERKPHPTDRRAKLLHLTPEGTALRKKLMAELSQGAPLEKLGAEELKALRDLLARAVAEPEAYI
jgi:DNA-binding MarR family transcriptional regulator